MDVFVPSRACERFEEIFECLISVLRFCLRYLGRCVWVNVHAFEAKEGVSNVVLVSRLVRVAVGE